MFSPNDQMLLPMVTIRPAFASPEPSTPARTPTRRSVRLMRPNIVRLIPGVTRLPVGYSPS